MDNGPKADVLRAAAEVVLEFLRERNLELEPPKLAQAIQLAYELLDKGLEDDLRKEFAAALKECPHGAARTAPLNAGCGPAPHNVSHTTRNEEMHISALKNDRFADLANRAWWWIRPAVFALALWGAFFLWLWSSSPTAGVLIKGDSDKPFLWWLVVTMVLFGAQALVSRPPSAVSSFAVRPLCSLAKLTERATA